MLHHLQRGATILAIDPPISIHRLLFACLLQCHTKWLTQHETANSLAFALDSLLPLDICLVHQIVLVEFYHLLFDECLDIGQVLRCTTATLNLRALTHDVVPRELPTPTSHLLVVSRRRRGREHRRLLLTQ